MKHDWDVIIVGSGFGGSVSALRLAERVIKFWLLKRGNAIVRKIFQRPIGICVNISGCLAYFYMAFNV